MRDADIRPVNPMYAHSENDQVGFADGYPILLLSEASLDDLNSRLETPLPMNRFRPNIVVTNTEHYAEDTWKTIRIGDITLDIVKPCARCAITTTNQDTAERGKEPLKILSTYRNHEHGVIFGQNIIHRNQGQINIGDTVEILA